MPKGERCCSCAELHGRAVVLTHDTACYRRSIIDSMQVESNGCVACQRRSLLRNVGLITTVGAAGPA